MSVVGVRVLVPRGDIVLLLRPLAPQDGEERLVLPVSIGPREGAAIASVQAGVVPPRPQTHDLMLNLLRETGHEVGHIVITELRGGVFYSEIVLDDGIRVDSRTSDAIALALRADSPVLCEPEVLAEGGVHEDDGEVTDAAALSEREVAQFREFLDNVEPEDFEDESS